MAILLGPDDEIAAGAEWRRAPPSARPDPMTGRVSVQPPESADDELSDEEEFDLVEQAILDAINGPPDRIEIHGRLFMRDGAGLYTNIEDADDDRIFEYDRRLANCAS